jgi:hypothetical protein
MIGVAEDELESGESKRSAARAPGIVERFLDSSFRLAQEGSDMARRQ